jgi:hypothetical protein
MAHRVIVSANNVVRVQVAADELYDKKRLDAIHTSVLTAVGHPGCCSGYLITYELAEGELSVP